MYIYLPVMVIYLPKIMDIYNIPIMYIYLLYIMNIFTYNENKTVSCNPEPSNSIINMVMLQPGLSIAPLYSVQRFIYNR